MVIEIPKEFFIISVRSKRIYPIAENPVFIESLRRIIGANSELRNMVLVYLQEKKIRTDYLKDI
jgi:hypothetical protein